jgi:hypothetical protein
MELVISGNGLCDDGHEIRLNGTSIFIKTGTTAPWTMPSQSNTINIGDVLEVYNYDIDSGRCWSAGYFNLTLQYNSQTWNIVWGTGNKHYWCPDGRQPTTCGPAPTEYPSLLASYRLDIDGPVLTSDDRYWCGGAETPASSLSSSSTSYSTSASTSASTSSGEFTPSGITYYSDFRDITSVNNPKINNNTKMQFNGNFVNDFTVLDFNKFGYGLKRTKTSQGSIFCNDASKLFSFSSGYLGMTISLPYSIANGIYEPLIGNNDKFGEYLLWGVNIGKLETCQPSLYAALTSRGIEFTIFTSAGNHTIVDNFSNIDANKNIILEFLWDSNYLDNYLVRSLIRVNGIDVAAGNCPISDDSMENLKFYALGKSDLLSNFECSIRKLVTYNKIPDEFIVEWWSSSSSSSDSTSLSTSSPTSLSSRSSNSSSTST